MAAHDDSHRTKNSFTGIASTPSFGEGIARKRRGNADEHACRHGDIRPPQELAYGDRHRSHNGSHDIAARQPLRKEQADKERCADKTRNSGGNIDNGADDGARRTRNAPCCEEVTPEVAICVKGGLVSSVYANANMDVDVYDLDVSDFPDEGEQEAADQKEAELDELVKSPGWRAVW